MLENPVISVVIPCYNQGMYIGDALGSLEHTDPKQVEVIIVNDGSTDADTNSLLQLLSSKYHVIFQENKGLGEARNTGIRKARGKYILPLDADNKISPRYIEAAIQVMDSDPAVAVVYGNAQYFGNQEGILKPGPFNLQRMMIGNYIDACAVIRKNAIEEAGYFDNMKIMGLEDWDLWLRIAFKGYQFRYIDETLFSYRVTNSSMLRSLNKDKKKLIEIEDYFIEKYRDKLDFKFIEDSIVYRIKKNPLQFFYRLLLKKYFPRRHQRLVQQHKIYSGYIYGRV